MARGCHGRFKKAESTKLEGTEKLGETWLRRQKHTKGCSAK
jgi:hypothetical protein